MPQDALAMLKDGNERFAVGAPTAGKVHQSMRADLNNMGQAPHTALVGCADSRVPLETVFDALPGDLFVLRNATPAHMPRAACLAAWSSAPVR